MQQMTIQEKTLPVVLWVGNLPTQRVENSTYKLLVISEITNASEILECLQGNQPEIVVSALTDLNESIKFLLEFSHKSPSSIRFLKVSLLTESILKTGLNQAQVMAVFDEKDSSERYFRLFKKAIAENSFLQTKRKLLVESKRQLREFESLNQSLKSIVEERTQHIENSRAEEDEKLNKSRNFVRFIKEMSMTLSFEEYLLVLRKELRKFQGIGEPYLIYRLSDRRVFVLHVQYGQSLESLLVESFNFSSENREFNQLGFFGLEKILANHFGRPFMRTLTIPLEIQMTQSLQGSSALAILGIEVSTTEKKALPFLDFISERAQILNICADRLLLENEYFRSSYRWEKTFDGLRDPIAIVDVDYHVLRANKKFFQISGQKKCFETFAGKTEPCFGCPLQNKSSEKGLEQGTINIGTKVFKVNSYPISIDRIATEMKATNFVNQYVDITQSRELYLRMLQSEKIGALGLLAGNIAHELNNPLTGLRSLTQVLIQEVSQNSSLQKSSLVSDLIEIEKATERSQKIIYNLLEFSTEESTERKKISLDEIVQRTLPLLKTSLHNHRYVLDLQTASNLVSVEPQMIQQVVFNLINNACQAMNNKGSLFISTCLSVQSKLEVQLIIQDSGSGIPIEIQDRIFEPFFTTKKEGVGTGLGLSFAKKVVEKYGGSICFESSAKEGTRFIVSFPVVEKNE